MGMSRSCCCIEVKVGSRLQAGVKGINNDVVVGFKLIRVLEDLIYGTFDGATNAS